MDFSKPSISANVGKFIIYRQSPVSHGDSVAYMCDGTNLSKVLMEQFQEWFG